jgi:GH18 family chitinase
MNNCYRNAGTHRRRKSSLHVLRLLSVFTAGLFGCVASSTAAELWATAYFPASAESIMPLSDIDFSVITHVIQFSLMPTPDGSFDENAGGITRSNTADLVSVAHAAGKKVLICVGGANSGQGFRGAISNHNRAAFISALVRFMSSGNYDGIDLDWEPLLVSDFPQYTNLVLELRTAMDSFPTRKLLTAAASAYPTYGDPAGSEYGMFSTMQAKFDQINIMTYDLSGAYAGWVTWFNSPIYDGGCRFSTTGSLVPSIDGAVENFLTNGVSPGKLGIGVAFYGDVWSGGTGASTGGVSQPRQSWVSTPTVTQVPYAEIMSSYYQSNFYRWDTNAQAAYLSIDRPGAADDKFISYDDEHTCEAKVRYAREHGLGGIMIWQLAQDHRSDQPAGRRDPLVQAIQRALVSPNATGSRLDVRENRTSDSLSQP